MGRWSRFTDGMKYQVARGRLRSPRNRDYEQFFREMTNVARGEKLTEVKKQKSLNGLERVGPAELEKYSGDTSRGP
jgi:hypothetical protein